MARGLSSEHQEQCVVIEWKWRMMGRYPELELLHSIPNGAKLPYKKGKHGRWSSEAIWLKAEGLLPGVSDLHLPVPRGKYASLYVELKYGANKPTTDQESFLKKANSFGNLGVVCWGADAGIAVIERYLNLQSGSTMDVSDLEGVKVIDGQG